MSNVPKYGLTSFEEWFTDSFWDFFGEECLTIKLLMLDLLRSLEAVEAFRIGLLFSRNGGTGVAQNVSFMKDGKKEAKESLEEGTLSQFLEEPLALKIKKIHFRISFQVTHLNSLTTVLVLRLLPYCLQDLFSIFPCIQTCM